MVKSRASMTSRGKTSGPTLAGYFRDKWNEGRSQASSAYADARKNPSGRGPSSHAKTSTRKPKQTASAGYAGTAGKADRNPSISGGAPKMGKAPKPTKTTPKPPKRKAAAEPTPAKKRSSGFDFGGAIARGFGGSSAWSREKKKAGVRD